MELYHYTNEKGFKGIMASRKILESVSLDDGDDARFGTGVYLTSLEPKVGKEAIIANCWGPNQVVPFLGTGRVDYYICVTLPLNLVKKATKKRDVYLHKGILYLDQYPFKGGKV